MEVICCDSNVSIVILILSNFIIFYNISLVNEEDFALNYSNESDNIHYRSQTCKKVGV